jgi:hypothetical protein
MKNLKFFSLSEWLILEPLRAFLKELRNDVLLTSYKYRKAEYEDQFLEKNKHFKDKNILAVIAFEQPKVLEWLFALSSKNLKDCQLMVFDNSKSLILRREIEELCQKWDIPYLSLPILKVRHPNRSHGLAMTWVFHRIIKKLQPYIFGYLDHDMYPVKPVSLSKFNLDNQDSYGLLNDAPHYWNLWAGYCFYKFSAVKNKPLNFLYDFSRGIDTGGRNWPYLYKSQVKSLTKFSSVSTPLVSLGNNMNSAVQLIDEVWVHVGGVSYNNNLKPKEEFHSKLVETLLDGKFFDDLMQ